MRTAVLALFAIISLPFLSWGQSTLTFPRVMQPGDFSTTGFALVNPGSTNATVTFTLYGENGNPQTATQTITARGQIAKLASELFPGVRNAGWIQATSGAAGLQGFWFAGNFSTFADGAEAALSSAELVLPLVAPQSEINIANTGTTDVTVLMNLLGADGTDSDMPFPQLIRAKGFFRGQVSALFPRVDDFSIVTHMRITCACSNGSPFAATMIARDFIAAPSWAVVNALPASTSTLTLNFPQLVDGPQGSANWRSVVGVTNLSATSPNDVTISFMSETGTPLLTTTRTLQPNGGIRATAHDFGLPAGFQNGWVQVTSVSGLPVTGYIAYAEMVAAGVAVVPPQQEAQTNLLFAHIADLQPWSTGVALLNTSIVVANVELFAMNPDGSLIGSASFPLQPGTKIARLLSELIPQSQSRTSDGGFLFVRSNVPIYGIELFFSRNNQIFSNVAAGRVAAGIQFVPPSR